MTLPIEFDASGLVPAVVQDAESLEVLMLGFMNETALRKTRETGLVHFWSRSRNTLWLKGETSGHTLALESIRVNCEQNSLLVLARPKGAVCHEGYPTCYFRELEPDDSLRSIRDRGFDPEDVYGSGGIAAITRQWWEGFQKLLQPEFAEISGTARVLQAEDDSVTPRIADELHELAGVLDGTHVHRGRAEDLALEAGQTCYWVLLACLRQELSWNDVRPDQFLSSPVGDSGPVSRLIQQLAERWKTVTQDAVAAAAQQTFALVASALQQEAIDPAAVIADDLRSLNARINSYQAG